MEDGSAETVNAELNIFDSLPYQVSHIKGDWVRIVTKIVHLVLIMIRQSLLKLQKLLEYILI